MTRSARRRWTRELTSEVDGIAVGSSGPVLLHGYDPPAGGRWIDDAIPGKLAALDRNNGEILWVSPCEVGYGRGFGAGFGPENDVIVVGPSNNGHRIVRMSLANGELLAAAGIPAFDEALVSPDLVVLLSAGQVLAIDTKKLEKRWNHAREAERYHHLGRNQNRVFVVASNRQTKRQGVFSLDVKSGKVERWLVQPNQRVIHDIAVDKHGLTLSCSDLEELLPREALIEFLVQRGDDIKKKSQLALVCIAPDAGSNDAPLWYELLDQPASEEFPEISITADSGKLYVVRGALLEVRDGLTGRPLDEWAVPGLYERVGWSVAEGAGLLAEETRVSIFELPA